MMLQICGTGEEAKTGRRTIGLHTTVYANEPTVTYDVLCMQLDLLDSILVDMVSSAGIEVMIASFMALTDMSAASEKYTGVSKKINCEGAGIRYVSLSLATARLEMHVLHLRLGVARPPHTYHHDVDHHIQEGACWPGSIWLLHPKTVQTVFQRFH